MTTFKCLYCSEDHVVPEKYLEIFNDYTEFSKGKIHNFYRYDVVVCDGYTWFPPKDTHNYPGDEYEYAECSLDNIDRAEYRWEFGHGDSGGWIKMTDGDKGFARLMGISPYSIVAISRK